MTQQLNGLADMLGRVDVAEEETAQAPAETEEPPADDAPSESAETREPTLEEAIDALVDD